MSTSANVPRRVRPKTYSIAFYLVILFILLQVGIVIWAFVLRKQVLVDVQAPELYQQSLAVSTTNSTRPPKPADLVIPDSRKPEPIRPQADSRATLNPAVVAKLKVEADPVERIKNLQTEAQRWREQGERKLALNALQEAERINPRQSQTLLQQAELAEAMENLPRARDYWKRLSDLGVEAGSLREVAQARFQALDKLIVPETPPEPPARVEPPPKPAHPLAIGKIEQIPVQNTQSITEFLLRIPIQSTTPGTVIEPGKVAIKLYFYDQLADGKIVPSIAKLKVAFEGIKQTWTKSDEVLVARYSLPRSISATAPGSERKFYGYRMRIYYRGELQDETAEPKELVERFPITP